MSPRIWLWIGTVLLLIGVFNAITRGGFGSTYGLGYMTGAILIPLAILYFGWYRRRTK